MATAPSGLSQAMSNPSAFMTNVSASQTVPGGSQNVNPLGGSVFSTLASTSPVVATLPGQGAGAGSYPGFSGGIAGIQAPTQTTPTGVTSQAGGFNPTAGILDPSATTKSGGDFTMMGDFQQTYGRGTGTAIANTLANLGTSTSIAEQNMINATMASAQKGYGNIEAGMAARGVSADSSTAGLAAGDYWGQVSQGIASETGKIGLSEEETLISALTGEGQAHGSDVSGWDQFGNVMSGIGNAAVGLGEAYFTGGMMGTGSITGGLSQIFHSGSGGGISGWQPGSGE